MFEDATFHSRGVLPNQAPKWMLLTLAINLAGLAALIVLPLIYPEALTPHFLHRILYTPPAEPKVIVRRTPMPLVTQPAQPLAHAYPIIRLTPPSNTSESDAQPTSTIIDLSPVIGAVPDNVNLRATGFPPTTPPPSVKPAEPRIISVSRGVSEGLLISKINPEYPAIARATRTAGTVVLAATISTTGQIENLKVLSGPPTLQRAALDAVKRWRYRPYLLNNQPVEVETTINIVFSLGTY